MKQYIIATVYHVECCTTTLLFLFCFCFLSGVPACMAINVSVQYNGGLLPESIVVVVVVFVFVCSHIQRIG